MTARIRLLGRVAVTTRAGGLALSEVETDVLAALLVTRPGGLTDAELGTVALPPGTSAERATARLEEVVPPLFADLRAAGAGVSVSRAGDRWRATADHRAVDADDLARLVARVRQLLDDGFPADALVLLDQPLAAPVVLDRPLDGLDDPWFDRPRQALSRLQADALVAVADTAFANAVPGRVVRGLSDAVTATHLALDVRLWDRLAVALLARFEDAAARAALDRGAAALTAAGRAADAATLQALRSAVAGDPDSVRSRVARQQPARPPAATAPKVRPYHPPPAPPSPPAPSTPPWGTAASVQPRPPAPSWRTSAASSASPAPSTPPTTVPAPAAPARTPAPDPLRWNLFGPVLLRRGRRAVRLDDPSAGLLATLLLRRGSPVGADVLAAAMWPDEQPPDPATGVEVHLDRVTEAVAPAALPVVRSGGPGQPAWTLRPAPADVDVDLASTTAAVARAETDPRARADLFRAALQPVPGTPLAGLPASWSDEREQLAAWRESLLLEAVAADLAAGLTERALPDLRTLVEAHPLREDLWEWLVVATGRHEGRTAALAVYDRAAHRLDRLLGAAPGPRLRAARREAEERFL